MPNERTESELSAKKPKINMPKVPMPKESKILKLPNMLKMSKIVKGLKVLLDY